MYFAFAYTCASFFDYFSVLYSYCNANVILIIQKEILLLLIYKSLIDKKLVHILWNNNLMFNVGMAISLMIKHVWL